MYCKKDIDQYREKYLKIADKNLRHGEIESALDALYHLCAMEHLFNFSLNDGRAEKLIQKISDEYFPADDFDSTEQILFYDSVAITNSALSMQYLQALNRLNRKVIYIISNHKALDSGKGLIEYAKSCGFDVEIITECCHSTKTIKNIRNIIAKYRPKHIILHMSNDDVYGNIAFANVNSATRYYINHGDEQFWLGTNIADYVIEFRGMGLDTSVRHRGFKESQCLVNPYYPIIKQDTFQGFDFDIPKDKVVLFSGGRFVKVYAESGRFLDVVRQILEESPTAFYIFAGSGNNKPMLDYIEKYGLGNRWKVISYRSDLLEVMKHVDIYLGTYPQSGGLMSQYAAAAGTPLVEMNTNNGGVTEDLLPRLKDWKITVDDWPAYFEQVRRLVNDAEYRRTFSAAIKESLISEEDFSENLKKILETNTSSVPYVRRETNIELRSSRLLEAENSYLHRVPGIMCNKMILKNYPFTGIYNIFQFYRYKNKRS